MLYVPPAAHAVLEANLGATPGTSYIGSTATASGSINVKGAWAQLVAATSYDSAQVCITLTNTAVAGAQPPGVLVDIGVGAAASEQVVLSNLQAGGVALLATNQISMFVLPLRIPKGVRVAARCQSSTASRTVEVGIFLMEGPANVSWPTVAGADAYGADTATSKGTALTPGNTGTESSWVNLGGTTSKPYKGVLLLSGQTSTNTFTAVNYHLELGIGSVAIGEWVFSGASQESLGGPIPPLPVMRTIPTGTQLQVRGECSGTALEVTPVAYGLY